MISMLCNNGTRCYSNRRVLHPQRHTHISTQRPTGHPPVGHPRLLDTPPPRWTPPPLAGHTPCWKFLTQTLIQNLIPNLIIIVTQSFRRLALCLRWACHVVGVSCASIITCTWLIAPLSFDS